MKRIKIHSTADFNHNCTGDYYQVMMDMFDIAPIAEWKMDNEGSVGKNQRDPDKKHVIKIVKTMRKERELCLWALMIGLDCDLIVTKKAIDEDGTPFTVTYLLWPETPEEIAKYAPHIQIGDGQHRALAAGARYGLKEEFGEFPVTVFFLDHPTEEEMIRRFCQVNGRGKPMSKDLLFEFNQRLGDLEGNANRMYELLKMAAADEKSPLHKKIKFGTGKGFSSMTITNKTCNESHDLIATMESVGLKDVKSQYKAFNSYMTAVCKCTFGPAATKFNHMSATRIAYAVAMMEPILTEMKDRKMRRTVDNFWLMFKMYTTHILKTENILKCDNAAMTYIDADGIETRVNNRWNGNGSVQESIQKDCYLFHQLCKGKLTTAA